MTFATLSTPEEFSQPRTVSRLAITSLILSLIFCCPVTTIAGIVTGAIAVVFTTKDRSLSGRWIAILAIAISLAGTALQIGASFQGYNLVIMPILTGPQAALKDGESGDISEFQSHFALTAAQGNTAEDAKSFLDDVKERYGTFTGASLDQGSAPNKLPSAKQGFVGDYQLDFANGRVRATCDVEIVDAGGNLSMKLKSLLIHDAKEGDIAFPTSALEDSAKNPSTPKQ